MRTLDGLLAATADPSGPLLTYYDLSSGERIELSTTTTANWVAKTSNFLVDDIDAGPGSRIRIGLPSHWLTTVWILSAWTVGAAVVDAEADIGLTGPDLQADEPARVAASLRPLGGRFASAPEGFLDLAVEVPGHGDHFMALDPPEPSTPALHLGPDRRTHEEVLVGAEPDGRRLLVLPGEIGRDADLIVRACLGGGSLVIVTSATAEQIDRIGEQEGAEPA